MGHIIFNIEHIKMKDKKNGVIRTQKDLDSIMSEEKGIYYISIDGLIASFEGKFKLNLIEVNDRLSQMSAGTSEAIAEAAVKGDIEEKNNFINLTTKTYIIPFRFH